MPQVGTIVHIFALINAHSLRLQSTMLLSPCSPHPRRPACRQPQLATANPTQPLHSSPLRYTHQSACSPSTGPPGPGRWSQNTKRNVKAAHPKKAEFLNSCPGSCTAPQSSRPRSMRHIAVQQAPSCSASCRQRPSCRSREIWPLIPAAPQASVAHSTKM
jgi:hypothetical protein